MAIEVPAVAGKIINLGRAGENLATTVVFDVSSWIEEFGANGTFSLFVQQGTNEYYLQTVTGPLNGKVKWEVTNSNTAIVGLGKCELSYNKLSDEPKPEIEGYYNNTDHQFYEYYSNNVYSKKIEPNTFYLYEDLGDNNKLYYYDGTNYEFTSEGSNDTKQIIVVKSMIYDIMVTNTLDSGAAGAVPDPIQSWINEANEVLDEVDGAADWINNMTVSAQSGSQANVEIQTLDDHMNLAFTLPKGDTGDTGAQGPQGQTGSTGPQGPTGPYFTPSVSTAGIISWTNNGGLTNPTSRNIKGPSGTNGVSPTLSSSKNGKTTTIYYTDATHTSSTVLATILDGADGIGSGNMNTATYDTHNKAQDIYDYADTKISAPVSPSNGNVLTYNGSTWTAQTPSSDIFIAVYGTTSFEDLNTNVIILYARFALLGLIKYPKLFSKYKITSS